MLTTLERVRAHRRLAADETSDDALLLNLIAAASAEFTREIGRVCVPFYAAHRFDAPVLNPFALDLNADLLEVVTLTNGDGTLIPPENSSLRPINAYPKWRIALKPGGGIAYTFNSDPHEAISVAGWWGYVPHYDTAWRATESTVPVGGMTAGTLTLDTTGAFEIGHYLRVDDEIMRVTARDSTTITLVRGEQGTTAANHSAGAPISVFDVLPDVQNAVTEMVAYAYKSLDRVGAPTGGRITVYDGSTVTVDDLDPLVRRAIADHRRHAVLVIR